MSKAMYGIPADGSAPFLMCILDMGEHRAPKIWKETAHLYTQKLIGYEIRDWKPETRRRK